MSKPGDNESAWEFDAPKFYDFSMPDETADEVLEAEEFFRTLSLNDHPGQTECHSLLTEKREEKKNRRSRSVHQRAERMKTVSPKKKAPARSKSVTVPRSPRFSMRRTRTTRKSAVQPLQSRKERSRSMSGANLNREPTRTQPFSFATSSRRRASKAAAVPVHAKTPAPRRTQQRSRSKRRLTQPVPFQFAASSRKSEVGKSASRKSEVKKPPRKSYSSLLHDSYQSRNNMAFKPTIPKEFKFSTLRSTATKARSNNSASVAENNKSRNNQVQSKMSSNKQRIQAKRSTITIPQPFKLRADLRSKPHRENVQSNVSRGRSRSVARGRSLSRHRPQRYAIPLPISHDRKSVSVRRTKLTVPESPCFASAARTRERDLRKKRQSQP